MYDVSSPLKFQDVYGLMGLNEARRANAAERRSSADQNVWDRTGQMSMPTVLPDTSWDPFFESVRDAKLVGGESPEGSRQLRGQSVQPDYLTTGNTFMGRRNADAPDMGIQSSEIDPSMRPELMGPAQDLLQRLTTARGDKERQAMMASDPAASDLTQMTLRKQANPALRGLISTTATRR